MLTNQEFYRIVTLKNTNAHFSFDIETVYNMNSAIQSYLVPEESAERAKRQKLETKKCKKRIKTPGKC